MRPISDTCLPTGRIRTLVILSFGDRFNYTVLKFFRDKMSRSDGTSFSNGSKVVSVIKLLERNIELTTLCQSKFVLVYIV